MSIVTYIQNFGSYNVDILQWTFKICSDTIKNGYGRI